MDIQSFGKCAECPTIKLLSARAELIERHKDATTELALDPAMEDIIQSVSQMAHTLGQEAPLLSSEEIVRHLRQTAAEHLDYADQDIEELRDGAEMLAEACDGPLKLRASRTGIQYIVKLCGSPAAPLETDGEFTEVTRTIISD